MRKRARAVAALPLLIFSAANAVAVDPGLYMNDAARGSPHLTMARAFIGGGNFAGAIGVLEPIIVADPADADALSLMGFSQRKNGNPEAALGYYTRALALDPEHLGANEYLGELYVETGKLDLAEERLGMLEAACGRDCEAYQQLAAVIAAAR